MTYYSDQVAAYQRQMADAMSGKRLRDSIRQLPERSKIVNTLKPLQARGDITAKKKIGKRTGDTGTDYVEISRSFHTTLRTLYDSSGVFQIRYYNVSQIIMDRGKFSYLDYDPASS